MMKLTSVYLVVLSILWVAGSTDPTLLPTVPPTVSPTNPTSKPSMIPSSQPSMQPTNLPTAQPTAEPTSEPSHQPSSSPTSQPSSQPSAHPSGQPTQKPTSLPTTQPSALPSGTPTVQPTSVPSAQPLSVPSTMPSAQPSSAPTAQPTVQPSSLPTAQPFSAPTSQPSMQPTTRPSAQPFGLPTGVPTNQPTGLPTMQPSAQPSGQPSAQPTSVPTAQPSSQPTSDPTGQPTEAPSGRPSTQPTSVPTRQPSAQPSSLPSAQPVSLPSAQPTVQPTSLPTAQPSSQPSSVPSAQPSSLPSSQPSSGPTVQPSAQPTGIPTSQPTNGPTSEPSTQPSVAPSGQPSTQPSSLPTTQPTLRPSGRPSAQPSSLPTSQPSAQPTSEPSGQPSGRPSGRPSAQPSSVPTRQPTSQPTSQPSTPTSMPSSTPSTQPTTQPSRQPSTQPTGRPSAQPSVQPTTQPTGEPSGQPSSSPSAQPSSQPSLMPTGQPSSQPTVQPTAVPSSQPSLQPSSQPTTQPSAQPTSFPTCGYGSGGTAGDCYACPPGQYGSNRDLEGCETCPQGWYTSEPGQTECAQCTYPSYTLDAGQSECAAFCACWSRRQSFTAFVFIGGLFFFAALYGSMLEWRVVLMLVLPVTNMFSDFAYLTTETFMDTTFWLASLLCMVLPFSVFLARLCADGSWSALSYHPGNLLGALCGRGRETMPTIWLGRSIEGVPTYAGKKLLPRMLVNDGAMQLVLFGMYWVFLFVLQALTLVFYLLWVGVFFPLWLPVLVLGYFYYQTKVLSLRRSRDMWLGLWSGDRTRLWSPRSGVDYQWLLESITAEALLQSLPQAYIQYTNNVRRGQWSILGLISFGSSVLMVIFFLLYRVAAFCNPKLLPKKDDDDDPTPGKQYGDTPPGTPYPRPPSLRTPRGEVEMTPVGRDQHVQRALSSVSTLSEKVFTDTPEEQLWLLLLSNQRDLKMATLMRAYGLTTPQALIKSSGFTLDTLKKALKNSPGTVASDLKLFDKLCVDMQEKYPDGALTKMVKGAVAFASGASMRSTAGDAAPEKQGGMLAFLIPFLVRSEPKEPTATEGDNGGEGEAGAKAASADLAEFTVGEFILLMEPCWGPVHRFFAGLRGDALWLWYGPGAEGPEAPPTVLGRLNQSVSIRAAAVASAVTWAAVTVGTLALTVGTAVVAFASYIWAITASATAATWDNALWLALGAESGVESSEPVPDTLAGRLAQSTTRRVQRAAATMEAAPQTLHEWVAVPAYERVVVPFWLGLLCVGAALAAPFVYAGKEVHYILRGDEESTAEATEATPVTTDTLLGRLRISAHARWTVFVEFAAAAGYMVAYALWAVYAYLKAAVLQAYSDGMWIVRGNAPGDESSPPAPTTMRERLAESVTGKWVSLCHFAGGVASGTLAAAKWLYKGAKSCGTAMVERGRWLCFGEYYTGCGRAPDALLDRLMIVASCRWEELVWLVVGLATLCVAVLGAVASVLAATAENVRWLAVGDATENSGGSPGGEGQEPTVLGRLWRGVHTSITETYANARWLLYGYDDALDLSGMPERFVDSFTARWEWFVKSAQWLAGQIGMYTWWIAEAVVIGVSWLFSASVRAAVETWENAVWLVYGDFNAPESPLERCTQAAHARWLWFTAVVATGCAAMYGAIASCLERLVPTANVSEVTLTETPATPPEKTVLGRLQLSLNRSGAALSEMFCRPQPTPPPSPVIAVPMSAPSSPVPVKSDAEPSAPPLSPQPGGESGASAQAEEVRGTTGPAPVPDSPLEPAGEARVGLLERRSSGRGSFRGVSLSERRRTMQYTLDESGRAVPSDTNTGQSGGGQVGDDWDARSSHSSDFEDAGPGDWFYGSPEN